MRKIILTICLIFPLFSFPYLEYKFWCKVSDWYVKISLWRKDWYVKCLKILENLEKKISIIKSNQSLAYKNYILSHSNYRRSIYKQQTKDLEILDSFRKNLVSQIKQFESNLFVKVKNFLVKYFEKKIKDLDSKIYDLKIQQDKFLIQWNKQKLSEVYKKIGHYQLLKKIMQDIINSQDFSQLIPLLKLYVQITRWK